MHERERDEHWPLPKGVGFATWFALCQRAAGIRLAQSAEDLGIDVGELKEMLFDAMCTLGADPNEERDNVDGYFSRTHCPSNNHALLVVTRACVDNNIHRDRLPVPLLRDRLERVHFE